MENMNAIELAINSIDPKTGVGNLLTSFSNGSLFQKIEK